MAVGEYDEVLSKTLMSPHAYFCIAFDYTKRQVAGMYIGTYIPAGLRARLHVDYVVVSVAYRRRGVLTTVLFPHMHQLAKELGCSSVELTASEPAAQSAYKKSGFISETMALRFKL